MNNRFDPTEEVRFAVVMYGGVSLAIYINGVAQELFSLVRATAPELDTDGEPTGRLLLEDAELLPVELVYRRLGSLHGPSLSQSDATVRRRFVIDIISGSSAGGINGVYLAKALANDQSIRSLKDLWVEKGDVAELLDDRTTRERHRHRIDRSDWADSLFSGDLMFMELLDALSAMDEDKPSSGPDHANRSPYVDELDLWLTTTDLEGALLPIQLADQEIPEKRHRHVFHFVFGEAQAASGRRNEFHGSLNRLLAFAARATSSFPFAFEPARLADTARVQARSTGSEADRDAMEGWRAWFKPHSTRAGFDFENVSFGDGGDMDNKPFGWAIDTLATRTSTTPVDRRLLYVEPDPGDFKVQERAAPMPNLIDSITKAFTLGRVENIRGDIERVAQRSEIRERVAAATTAIEDGYNSGVASEAERLATEDWLTESPEAMALRGLPYAAYFQLRLDSLVAELARSIALVPWNESLSPTSRALELLFEQWVAAEFGNPFEPVVDGRPSTKVLLRNFDIAYRIRRLTFVAGSADRLMRAAPDVLADRLVVMAPGEPDNPAGFDGEALNQFSAACCRIKRVLGEIESDLRLWVPSIRSNLSGDRTTLVLSESETEDLLSGEPARVGAIWEARRDEVIDFTDGVAKYLRAVFAQASAPVTALFAEPSGTAAEVAAYTALGGYYSRFADFDQVIFPLQVAAGVSGEVDPVQVHRLSPDDADSLVDQRVKSKLAGDRLFHFGGFIAADWRSNDIMWGRLDTVETLVRTLTAEGSAREELIRLGQDAVLQEEWYGTGSGEATTPGAAQAEPAAEDVTRRREQFRNEFAVPPWPELGDLLDTAARSSRVTSRIFRDLASQADTRTAHRVVAGLGWALSGAAVAALAGRFVVRAFDAGKRALSS